MNVTFNETVAGVSFVFSKDKTYEVEDEKAEKWIRAGLCRPASKPIETASAKPQMRTADATPVRKTRTKKEG